jgi:hypothetical protein
MPDCETVSLPWLQVCLPTSTGYGTAFNGVAPMLAALNSSAPGEWAWPGTKFMRSCSMAELQHYLDSRLTSGDMAAGVLHG